MGIKILQKCRLLLKAAVLGVIKFIVVEGSFISVIAFVLAIFIVLWGIGIFLFPSIFSAIIRIGMLVITVKVQLLLIVVWIILSALLILYGLLQERKRRKH